MAQEQEYKRTTALRADPRRLRHTGALVLAIALIVVGILYPFDIHPPNGVRWIEGGGLAFDGSGISQSDRIDAAAEPFDAVTVELWLSLPLQSRNWGSRHVLTLWDGQYPPPLVVGLQAKRPFLFTRFEPLDGADYDQFHAAARLRKGARHFLAMRLSRESKSIWLDGRLVEERRVVPGSAGPPAFAVRVVLGDSPTTRRGVEAEITGVAVYRRALSNAELVRDFEATRASGMRALQDEDGLALLLPLDDGGGASAIDLVSGAPRLAIPARYSGLTDVFFDPAHAWRQLGHIGPLDAAINVGLFAFFGWALVSTLAPALRPTPLWLPVLAVLLSAAMSLSLEWAQIHSPSRVADIADLLFNTIGGAIGAALAFRRGATAPAQA